jgi:UDP-3-O-[3-hydroxymyristoyl] glucosamine N-acyltransferase
VAGQAGIADHVILGSGVTVAGRSGVTKDIADGETVSGFPARGHSEETRFQAALRRVPDMLERLKKIESKRTGGS